ncbi:hypothetical protein SDJN02_10539, partial [Cucurbita argyrosperma subsp. argyrosperma]
MSLLEEATNQLMSTGLPSSLLLRLQKAGPVVYFLLFQNWSAYPYALDQTWDFEIGKKL